MPRQSAEVRAALDATWQAHPSVVAFKAALRQCIAAEKLDFDVHGMNRTSEFSQQWMKDHGPLPNSGISTD